jgi:hypothetical protein
MDEMLPIPTYIDDVAWRSLSLDELVALLDACVRNRVTLKGSKTHLACKGVNLLGQVVTHTGLSIQPCRVADHHHLLPVLSASGARAFLGVWQYISPYIPSVASSATSVATDAVLGYRNGIRQLQQLSSIAKRWNVEQKQAAASAATAVLHHIMHIVALRFPLPGVPVFVVSPMPRRPTLEDMGTRLLMVRPVCLASH